MATEQRSLPLVLRLLFALSQPSAGRRSMAASGGEWARGARVAGAKSGGREGCCFKRETVDGV